MLCCQQHNITYVLSYDGWLVVFICDVVFGGGVVRTVKGEGA